MPGRDTAHARESLMRQKLSVDFLHGNCGSWGEWILGRSAASAPCLDRSQLLMLTASRAFSLISYRSIEVMSFEAKQVLASHVIF
jgi:hypothetical protein